MASEEDLIKEDRIDRIDINEQMKSAYIDYSMSVIVSRALPDVRDGLKPVHRRVLFGMNEMGNTSSNGYKKSANCVGEVMGKYHPHGDSSIYGTGIRPSTVTATSDRSTATELPPCVTRRCDSAA